MTDAQVVELRRLWYEIAAWEKLRRRVKFPPVVFDEWAPSALKCQWRLALNLHLPVLKKSQI